ncbi:hypothetical protein C6A85_95750, partial [Mycobacterium sp. ITM-2017-0098]
MNLLGRLKSGETHFRGKGCPVHQKESAPAGGITGTTSQPPIEVDVLIVGAGVSGISMACHLQVAHPQRSFAMLDARGATGGTWDQFRYPGIRSDSDLQTFGYRFKPWTGNKSLAPGDAILDYIREAAAEHDVSDRIWTRHKVESADWSSRDQRWHVLVVNTVSGKTFTVKAGWLATAAGMFSYDTAYIPEFPGRDDFKGTFLHPQFWPSDLDYAGKKIVVIGSGATAVTLVPAVVDDASHVTMLQR